MVNSQLVLFALPYWYVSRVGMHPHSVACRYVYDDEQAVWFGSFPDFDIFFNSGKVISDFQTVS